MMTREQAQNITRLLADPTRFEIFERIAQCSDEMACADLRSFLTVTPATLSHHLKELADAKLIKARRAAKFMHLKVNRKTWKAWLAWLQKLA
jgi:ArsR family transcriptional regulator